MKFGELLRNSWNILKTRPLIFLFALVPQLSTYAWSWLQGLSRGAQANPETFSQGIVLLTCGAGILYFALAQISIAGMVMLAYTAHQGKKMAFREAMSEALRPLGRLMMLPILLGLGVVVLAMLFGVIKAAVSALNLDLLLLCLSPLLCLVLPLSMLFSPAYIFTEASIVIRDWGVGKALISTWQHLQRNLGKWLVFGLLVMLLSLAYMALYYSFSWVRIGVFVPGIQRLMADSPTSTFLTGLVGSLGLVIIYALSTFWSAFMHCLYTLAYLDFNIQPPIPLAAEASGD